MKLEKMISIAVAILTIGGMVYIAYSKPAAWDQTVKDVGEMRPKVELHGQQLAAADAHYQDIIHRLDQISDKLDQ